VGKAAIEAARESKDRLCAFEMVAPGVARDGYPVLNSGGEKIGYVTSGSHSPSTGKNIGLAYVPAALAAPGSEIFVEIRGKSVAAKVVKAPFVPSRVRKNT
jgi:aminomethyltransferase